MASPYQAWELEPDEKDFSADGYECRIERCEDLGHLSGYVFLPPTSRFFGLHYDDPVFQDIQVHGGLTFSDEESGVIGFDCCHAGDLLPYNPGMSIENLFGDAAQYRDIHYVESELRRLVEQLKERE